MKRKRIAIAGIAAYLTVLGAAHANDSTAELAAGGLVLTRTHDIEMRAEDLRVSQKKIAVTYRFLNRAANDQTATVAFPMPDVRLDFVNGMTSVPFPGTDNYLGFSTKVDGAPVATKVEMKAYGNNTDQTALLNSLHIPIYPDVAYEGLSKLSRVQQEKLVKLGLADEVEEDGKTSIVPGWTVRGTYYFPVTFPAGREITIAHDYTPAVGSSIGTSIAPEDGGDPVPTEIRDRYCIEPGFVAAAAKLRKTATAEQRTVVEKRVSYILHTGSNWAAPIHDFRLVIDRGDANALVTFCGDGVTKTSPTTFEIRKTDFSPSRDLDVLLLTTIKE